MNKHGTRSALAVQLVAVSLVCGAFTVTGQTQDEVDLLNQYMQVMKIDDSLQIYNQQQEGLISAQEKEMAVLRESIGNVTDLSRQIPPLLHNMVSGLEKFVELDIPFRMAERQANIESLRELMERPDIDVSEKFIHVMQAYERETEYGNSYETYSDVITLNGKQRQVDILRFGRVSLSFQTPDLAVTGVWNNPTREWEILGNEYRMEVRNGIRMASNAMTPNIVALPVTAPQETR